MHKIYTFGYQQRKPEELQAEVGRLGAVVIDVRIKPYSRVVTWNKKRLQAMFGAAYRHIYALGNENYKAGAGAPVKLVNEQGGLAQAREILAAQPLILLCYEADPATCHRTYIAERLAEMTGAAVVHLRPARQERLC